MKIKRKKYKGQMKEAKSLNELHKQRVKDYRSRFFTVTELNSFREKSKYFEQ